MFCPKCGANIQDGSSFCTSCGASIVPKRQGSVPKKKRKSKWWIWLIVAFVIIGIIGNNGEPKDTKTVETTSTPKATSAPKATPKPTPQATPEPSAAPICFLGDTVSVDNLDFTIKRAIFSQYAGNMNGYNPSGSDYRYCVVYLDVTNTTNETKKIISPLLLSYVSDYGFTLVYDGEVEYKESFGKYTDFLFGNEEILPLATLTDKILNFKIPVSLTSTDKQLAVILTYKNDKVATWIIR